MNNVIKRLALFAGILLLSVAHAQAQHIELRSNPADLYGGSGTTGSARGTGFQANQTLTVSEIALSGAILDQSYTVEIYASADGNTADSLLHSASAVVGGPPAVIWNAVPIDFTFDSGSYYVVNWRPTDNTGNFSQIGVVPGTPAGIEYYWPNSFPYDIVPGGEVTLIQGFISTPPDNGNPLIPVFRFTVGPVQPDVPVPVMGKWGLTAFALLLLFIGGMVISRRRGLNL